MFANFSSTSTVRTNIGPEEQAYIANFRPLWLSNGTVVTVDGKAISVQIGMNLTVVGSKKMLLYEGKFEKRAVTMYEYAVEEDCGHGDLVEERPTTIPAKIIAEHMLPGLTDEEPLVLAVSDFLVSILHHRAPVSDAASSH